MQRLKGKKITTIAVNQECIAGDKQCTYGSTKLLIKSKIYELSEAGCANFNAKKILVGFCGNVDSIGDAIHWLNNPTEKEPKVKKLQILMLNNKKEIWWSTNSVRNFMRVDQKYFALGTGADYAISAMQLGKSPIEAVKLASQHDIYTGMGFNELTL